MTMCMHVHVWWGSKVTNDFCITKYTRHGPHGCEGTVHTVGHSLFLNTLSSWLSWTSQTLDFPSTSEEASLPPFPRFQMLEGLRAQS